MEKYKYSSFAMETASEYKYQIAMETAEQNTSIRLQQKLWSGIQVSKLVQRKLHSEMYTSTQEFFFFFFFKRSKCGEKWNEGILGL